MKPVTLDRLANNTRTGDMPDATRLIAYAQAREMVCSWRTRPVAGQWEAEVTLHHMDGGATPLWGGAGDIEQAALDQAIERAVYYWSATGAASRNISHGGT